MPSKLLVVVGEAPSCRPGPAFASGRSGKLIDDLFGSSVKKINLFLTPRSRLGKGYSFPIIEAQARAGWLLPQLAKARIALLAGHRVAAAFGIRANYFEKVWLHGICFYIFPHPSGINRWWNDPENHARAKRFARMIVVASDGGRKRRRCRLKPSTSRPASALSDYAGKKGTNQCLDSSRKQPRSKHTSRSDGTDRKEPAKP